ncbi:MAG TPA: DUF6644 family protein [Steroidobacteraceae bacterium]|nr:DUF6644 family protein [Steroidobacteraceae bacterium]
MQLEPIYEWVQSTSLADAIGQSSYLFPLIESLHVLSITVMMGTIALVDLRLVGLINRERPVSQVLREVLPFTIAAFVSSVVTGTLLFTSHAVQYMGNGPFVAKMVLMGVAGVNILIFHGVIQRTMQRWDLGKPPLRAVVAGSTSLFLWIAVVACGRWIGFTSPV